jgi:hypothetical protein
VDLQETGAALPVRMNMSITRLLAIPKLTLTILLFRATVARRLFGLACGTRSRTTRSRSLGISTALGILVAFAPTLQGQFRYSTNNGAVTILAYTGTVGVVTVPSSINGLPVREIGLGAFSGGTNITSISIPDTVIRIGESAFSGCTNLTNVSLGMGVTTLGDYSFSFCKALPALSLPNSVTNIGSWAFWSCSALEEITLPSNLKNLADYTFTWCQSLKSITIPDKVTTLGQQVFDSCLSLSTATLPASLTNIGSWTFHNCWSLVSITVAPANTTFASLDGVLFNPNLTTLIQFPNGRAGTYVVPNSVTRIVEGAFGYSSGLNNVFIPASVITIENYAFQENRTLTAINVDSANPNYRSLDGVLFDKSQSTLIRFPGGREGSYTVPPSVTNILVCAFAHSAYLTNVFMPSSVLSLGSYAFDDCTQLRGIYFSGNAPTVVGTTSFLHDESAVVYYLPGTSGWGFTYGGRPAMLVNSGCLQALIVPPDAVAAGAQWRVDGYPWQGSGTTISNLAVGTHSVSFGSVAGWTAPAPQVVSISAYEKTTVTGTYAQFGSLSVSMIPAEAMAAGAQWQLDSGEWQNDRETIARIPTGTHTVQFKAVAYWAPPPSQTVIVPPNAITNITATYLRFRAAAAGALVINGFVVQAGLTDCGFGYTNTPTVQIMGGGGSGAQAVAVVSNGVIAAINIINPGSGYTNTPTIIVAPPFFIPAELHISPASYLQFSNLLVGTNYQFQVYEQGEWLNSGSSFLASAPEYGLFTDGPVHSASYRVVALPMPTVAKGVAQLAYGFVVSASVTSGGSGYVSSPKVSIVGGGGSGAEATASVSGGSVVAINIIKAGSGYTSTPSVLIDPPPVVAVTPFANPACLINCFGLVPGTGYELQTSSDLSAWTALGAAFMPPTSTWSNYFPIEIGNRFFRLRNGR